eukprot:142636-Amorphochlora_amoeboformis.AAC.1
MYIIHIKVHAETHLLYIGQHTDTDRGSRILTPPSGGIFLPPMPGGTALSLMSGLLRGAGLNPGLGPGLGLGPDLGFGLRFWLFLSNVLLPVAAPSPPAASLGGESGPAAGLDFSLDGVSPRSPGDVECSTPDFGSLIGVACEPELLVSSCFGLDMTGALGFFSPPAGTCGPGPRNVAL